MKRSEAETRINAWLDNATEITGKTLIDFLVDELGMAPPEITVRPDSYNRAEGCMGYRVHEWEDSE